MSERMVQISEDRLRELQDKERILARNLEGFEATGDSFQIAGYVLNTPETWQEMKRNAVIGVALAQMPSGFALSWPRVMFLRGPEWKCEGLVPDPPPVLKREDPCPEREVEFCADTPEEAIRLAKAEADKAYEAWRAACRAGRDAEMAAK